MKLYNTLTREIEEIRPQHPPLITVYTCGPTVYDYSHIGHWFNYVRMDTLIRALRASKLKPKWVMNITDVGHLVSDADEGEDKLEKGARREGKTAWEVAQFYTEDFLAGMRALNMLMPDEMPRATDHIAEQIALIQQLETRGYTYAIDDGVYYDTSKFEGYAAFARLDLDDLQAGARVAVNPRKKNPADFALWKFSPKDHQRDMEWDSPWGKGFPGWHIECSAMSMKYLGETLDIHTGGIDHVPVHHTNEIAQSEAVTGKRFANVWMHGNHITVNGEKISKSLGNGIRLSEIMAQGISPMAVRLHVLESHYRSQSRFSWESLLAARNRLADYESMAALMWQAHDGEGDAGNYIQTSAEMLESLQDDLNTPEMLAQLSALSDDIKEQGIKKAELPAFQSLLSFLDATLGLNLLGIADISDEQKQLIAEREQARERHDWEAADALRAQLLNQKIGIRDTEHGPIWERVL
jgi:cysteinyl-tRNA synthetase